MTQENTVSDQPSVAAIVLAAGRSTRMAGPNKLLADVGGRPMVRRTAEAVLASRAAPVLVVVGHQAAEVSAALGGLDVAFVKNPEYAAGLSSSVKAGLGAVPPGVAGALIVLGDMPEIAARHLNGLIEAFCAAAGHPIVVPVHAGRRGNPVLWPARFFAEILAIEGDMGARQVLERHRAHIKEVEFETAVILLDVDTPEALALLRSRIRPD